MSESYAAVVRGQQPQTRTSEFTARELARLAVYRAAVAYGFYTDELAKPCTSAWSLDMPDSAFGPKRA